MMRRFGVLYQSGALWSSMTLGNVALGEYTDLSPREIREVVGLKLALVGLAGFEDFYPAEISGGMRKRAGLARAMALDPDILFFDEPSAGLDPLSSRRLDDSFWSCATAWGPRSWWSPTSWRVFLRLATAASSSMPRRRRCWRWESHDPAGYLTRAEDSRLPPAWRGRDNHGGVRLEQAHGRAGERNEGLWEVRSVQPRLVPLS